MEAIKQLVGDYEKLQKLEALKRVLAKAEEIAERREIPLERYLTDAIESKNEVEAGAIPSERGQG